MNPKKPIKEFGKVYDYLRSHSLRTKERQNGHIYVDDADFTGEEFINGTWKNFIFKRCYIPASHFIQQTETIGCRFMNCEFGPGRVDASLSFGKMTNGEFWKCTFTDGNVSFGQGHAMFKDCEFNNTYSNINKTTGIGGESLKLANCKLHDYGLLYSAKLHLLGCHFSSIEHGALYPRGEYTADLILEDTLLENAEEILWNAKIKNLTLKGCRVKGTFSAQHGLM